MKTAYGVACLGDAPSDGAAPQMVQATRQRWPDRDGAERYAAGVNQSRNPVVVELNHDAYVALEECVVAMGRAGANHDLNHPLRAAWQAAVKALDHAKPR